MLNQCSETHETVDPSSFLQNKFGSKSSSTEPITMQMWVCYEDNLVKDPVGFLFIHVDVLSSNIRLHCLRDNGATEHVLL